MLYAKLLFLIIYVLLVGTEDYKTHKIPNKLIVFGMAIALYFDLILYPQTPWTIVFKVIGIVILFFFGMTRLLGLGDIKLWMVLTAFLGLLQSSLIICIASILLVMTQFFMNKSTRGLIFLSVIQLIQRQKIRIIEQKGYAFAPYIAIVTIVFCVLDALKILKI